MKCVFCGYPESKVIDTRPQSDGSLTRRRRECLKCEKRFTTYEKAENTAVMIIKKDGRREVFDPEKIRRGLIKACEKRNISAQMIEKMTSNVDTAVANSLKSEIPAELVGELVMNELKAADEVAYVRFASVYREFKDVDTFMSELKKLMSEK